MRDRSTALRFPRARRACLYKRGSRSRRGEVARALSKAWRTRPYGLRQAAPLSRESDPERVRVSRRESWDLKCAALLRGFKCGRVARTFDFGRFLLAELHDVVHQLLIVELIDRLAVQVDHARAGTAAGETDIGFACFARTVDHAADDRKRHRRGDVLEPFFEHADRADDVEALARARWARNDVDAAVAQAKRLQEIETDADFFLGFGRKRNPDGIADSSPEQHADTDG